MSDVVQLLCDLSEAPEEVFRVGAMGQESEDGLRTLTNLGAINAGPRPASITCQACDADHFAALEFDARARSYIYFCPEAGWVAVDDADLATLRFDPRWLVDWLVSALAMPSHARRRALVSGRVWHLGDTRCEDAWVAIVLARRISSQAALDELASVLGTIPVANKGLVITTSPQAPRQVRLPHGFTFVDFRDIARMVGRQLRFDHTRLASWVKTAKKNPREPARLDYRQADKPLVDQMHEMILAGKASNPTDAARAIARRAAGAAEDSSKVKRLAQRYADLYRSK